MASSKKIKTRIKSIQSTHQITKAMEIVSTTKFRRYSLLAKESQAFSDSIQKILTNISMGVKAERHPRSEEHTSELQSRQYLVCRLLLEKNKTYTCLTVSWW